MITPFLISAGVLAAALMPKKKLSDKKKIMKVFVNREYGLKINDEMCYPRLHAKHDKDTFTIYVYYLPLGLASESVESLLPAVEEALRKEVEYEFEDGMLKLYVYHQKLPERWNYDETLLRPGTWEFPVGKNHKGIVFHDFEKYQHLLVGGVTRYGKTVLLKDILTTILLNNPNDVEFYIIDLKGGLEFYKYKALSQVKEVACDIFEAAVLLTELTEQLKKDEEYFRQNMYTNITETPIRKRKFIILDESAQLSPSMYADKDIKKFAVIAQTCLSELARLSGGLGYRLIISTQYPVKESVSMAIKSNIVARIAFVCANNVASRVLLDETGAEHLPAIPGRCIYLVDKQRILQVPYLDDKKMFKLMEEREDELTRKDRVDIVDDRQDGNGDNPAIKDSV